MPAESAAACCNAHVSPPVLRSFTQHACGKASVSRLVMLALQSWMPRRTAMPLTSGLLHMSHHVNIKLVV